MKRPIITGVTLDPKHAYLGEKVKIAVTVEEEVIPTAEPKNYMLSFALGSPFGTLGGGGVE